MTYPRNIRRSQPSSRCVWTEAVKANLRALWAEGHSMTQIGVRLGVSKNAIAGMARRLDLPRRGNPAARRDSGSSERRNAIAEDLRAGLSINECVRRHHAGEETIRKIRDAEGIQALGPDWRSSRARVGRSLPALPSSPVLAAPVPAMDVADQVVVQMPRVTRRCEWLDGVEKPWVQCSSACVPGKSWCAGHAARVFTKVPTWAGAA
jgi:GcrA cell cycle regulator